MNSALGTHHSALSRSMDRTDRYLQELRNESGRPCRGLPKLDGFYFVSLHRLSLAEVVWVEADDSGGRRVSFVGREGTMPETDFMKNFPAAEFYPRLRDPA